jgi:tRNA dimethylallyltransferase
MLTWSPKLAPGSRPEFIVVGGPTASGKSAVALEMAKALNGSIICCDSVQLYRGFDLGSAKPSKIEQSMVPHVLFDVFTWQDPCDAAIYAARARQAIIDISARGRIPIVVGGTGLYLRALLGHGWDDDVPSDYGLRQQLAMQSSEDLFAELTRLDPDRATQLHINDRFRVIRAIEINMLTGRAVPRPAEHHMPEHRHLMVLMNPSREKLYERINRRTEAMVEQGLLHEVRELLAAGVSPDCKAFGSIGYKEALAVAQGRESAEQLIKLIAAATRQYAKRQVTWFKKVPWDAALSSEEDAPELLSLVRGCYN